MKWEDTVMSEEQIEMIADRYTFRPNFAELLIAKAQAEISFNKGYDLGYDNAIRKDSEIYEAGVKDGIKEVVDWVRKNLPTEYGSISTWSVWEQQLKEWGIDANAGRN